MTAKRSKHGATRRGKSSRKRNNKRASWRWLWLLIGILLGGIAAGTLATKVTTLWNKSQQKQMAVKTKKPSKPRARRPKAAKKANKPQEIEFEFYKLLPDGSETRLNQSSVYKPKTRNYRYILRAGSFRKLTEADELKARLTLNGFKPAINKTTLSNKIWYRVQIGPFNNKQDAITQQQKLLQQHINGIIVKE